MNSAAALRRGALLAALLGACAAPPAPPAVVTRVGSDGELRAALKDLEPGDEIAIAPGAYAGGIWLQGARGTEDAPIVIRGADPADPPVFAGGGAEGWHLSGCSHLTLRDLVVRGFAGNGVNADDGGAGGPPAVGLRFERLRIEEIGPQGNHDGLKLSGVDRFLVRDCAFRGWGGSAADLVGCHDGRIENCEFAGLAGHSQSNGVQIKGGSARVTVRGCRFENAGARALNLGGSTGAAYFRPRGAGYEAAQLLVEGNEIRGGQAAVAFVSAVDCTVRGNRIELPEKWVLRILQESDGPGFAPCQNGSFEGNRVTFDARVRVHVNVGPGTRPETFRFADNEWLEVDAAGRPVAEPRRDHPADGAILRP